MPIVVQNTKSDSLNNLLKREMLNVVSPKRFQEVQHVVVQEQPVAKDTTNNQQKEEIRRTVQKVVDNKSNRSSNRFNNRQNEQKNNNLNHRQTVVQTTEKPIQQTEEADTTYTAKSQYDPSLIHYIPSIIEGFCDEDGCAKWSNDDVENFYNGSYYPELNGHAWTRFRHADPDKEKGGISGYTYMTREPRNRYDNLYNKQAADSLKKYINNFQLDPNEIYMVNMYYGPDSRNLPSYGEAYSYQGKPTLGSHTGTLYYDPEGGWKVNHNVHRYVSTVPLNDVLGGDKRTGITAIGRIPHKENITVVDKTTMPKESFKGYQLEIPGYSPYMSDLLGTLGITKEDYDKLGKPIYTTVEEDDHLINYPNGMNLSALGFIENPERKFTTMANIASPLMFEALASAERGIYDVAEKYGVGDDIVNQLYSMLPGILWKESAGGYPLYLSGGIPTENTQYLNNHLDTLWDSIRHSVRGNNVSRGMGSVKRSTTPINYMTYGVPEDSGVYSGINTLSAMTNNWVNLVKLFKGNEHLLFDEDGYISDLAKGLILEAHNQGTQKGIKASYDAYLKDNNLDHFYQYIDPVAAWKMGYNINQGYASKIWENVTTRLNNPSRETRGRLPEVIVTGYK